MYSRDRPMERTDAVGPRRNVEHMFEAPVPTRNIWKERADAAKYKRDLEQTPGMPITKPPTTVRSFPLVLPRPLTAGWFEATSEAGHRYYYNATDQTQWQRPTQEAKEAPISPGRTSVISEAGQVQTPYHSSTSSTGKRIASVAFPQETNKKRMRSSDKGHMSANAQAYTESPLRKPAYTVSSDNTLHDTRSRRRVLFLAL